MRLIGDVADSYTGAIRDTLPFEALVQSRELMPSDASLAFSDRLWLLPDILEAQPIPPDALLYELADIIRRGGKVGLAARDDVVCDRVRDRLVMML